MTTYFRNAKGDIYRGSGTNNDDPPVQGSGWIAISPRERPDLYPQQSSIISTPSPIITSIQTPEQKASAEYAAKTLGLGSVAEASKVLENKTDLTSLKANLDEQNRIYRSAGGNYPAMVAAQKAYDLALQASLAAKPTSSSQSSGISPNSMVADKDIIALARVLGADEDQIARLTELLPMLESGELISTPDGFVSKTNGQIYNNEDVALATTIPVAQSVYKSGNTVDQEVFKTVDFRDFLGEAGKFIDPYYTSKYEQTKNLVNTKLTQISEDLGIKKSDIQRQSEAQTLAGRETLAERGLTFSGQRNIYDVRQNENLNRGLSLADTEAYRGGQDILTQAEGQIGTENLQGVNIPSYGGRSLSFSSTPIKGDLPYQQYGAVDSLSRILATDENARKSLAYSYNLSKNSV